MLMQASSICICALKIQHRKNTPYVKGIMFMTYRNYSRKWHLMESGRIPDISPDYFMPSVSEGI